MGPEPEALNRWLELLCALPFPAAIVDRDENLIAANDLVTVPDGGSLLIPPRAGRSQRRSRAGADGRSRWRLQPLLDDGSALLAITEGDEARNHLLEVFFATGNALFVVFDPEGTVLEANDAWRTILGFDRDHLLGLDAWTLVEPEDLRLHRRDIEREVTETGRSERILRVRDRAGDSREIQWTFYFDHGVSRSFGIGRDVTEERERERILKDSHRTFEQVGEFLLSLDTQGVILSANPAVHRTLTIEPDEAAGSELRPFVHPDDWPRVVEAAGEAKDELRVTERLTRWRGPDQSDWRWIDGTFSFDPEFDRYHIVARDVTAERQLTAELERLAFTDELTGLANRPRLLDTLGGHLSGSSTPAVLFCDLDRFKVVNDSLGHQAGDELLRRLGSVLSGHVDGDDALVARIGGDEFVVVLGDADEATAIAVANGLLEVVAQPFDIEDRTIHTSLSIGIALARPGTGPGPGRAAEDLLGEADTAVYRAKDLGRNQYVMHDESMRQEATRRLELEIGLRRAIEHEDFEVHYQPIVALPGGGIIGMEALVRWSAADGTLRMPHEFLDVAQDAGLIDRIGHQVLATTLAQGARLAGLGRTLIVAVNVAASQLADPGFADRVVSEADRVGLDRCQLLVELTESVVLADDRVTMRTLESLRAAGVRIGLDDFGTGFSSLSHLRTLPIDVVKIDRSFVASLDDDVTRALTSSVIDLCRALGLDVVVEGVETSDQQLAVEQLGATWAQGYFLHRPMSADLLEDLLGIGPRHQVAGARTGWRAGAGASPSGPARWPR